MTVRPVVCRPDHFGEVADVGAVGLGGGKKVHGQTPGIHGGVGHLHGGLDTRVQGRLERQGLRPREGADRNPHIPAPVQETLPMGEIVLVQRHEEAAVGLDRLGREAAQNLIFLPALPGCFRIVEDIPGAAVQQAVVPAGGAGEQLALFHQGDPEAAQGEVVRQGASRSAADDQYVLQTRHVFQCVGCPSFK